MNSNPVSFWRTRSHYCCFGSWVRERRHDSSKEQVAHVPVKWGTPMYLLMSTLVVVSWGIPLQPSELHSFPFWEDSSLLGPRALPQILVCPAFFFSSISFFSFLFSCCRWTMTLWRWLWEEREVRRAGGRWICVAPCRKEPRGHRRSGVRRAHLFRAGFSHTPCVSGSPSVSHGRGSDLGVRKTRKRTHSASSGLHVYVFDGDN